MGDIVAVAREELRNSGKNYAGNKYINWLGNRAAVGLWCHVFVSWCANTAGVMSLVPKTASTYEGLNWFKKKGQFKARGSYTPRPGDIIYFKNGRNSAPVNHVGIVVGVSGSKVSTIEGNSGNKVSARSYSLSSREILGYGVPKYNNSVGGTTTGATGDAQAPAFDSDEPLNLTVKTAEITAVIIQRNTDGTGRDETIVCGTFQVDTIEGSGPPDTVSLKATSVPYTAAIRTEQKNKVWEKIKLSAILAEIAGTNSMNFMFESDNDPLYDRKEQLQESDIAFLKRLCTDAGISVKITSKTIVLFDEEKYEKKPTIATLKKGYADILSYNFSTGLNDTAYSSCHVSYTNPETEETIEYTYSPRNITGVAQVLEINEKVKTREEARQLAMKRLRQKNKSEFKADFSLEGNVLLCAGATVDVVGWGAFDGKYIIEQAKHTVSNGYETSVSLRKVLEGY